MKQTDSLFRLSWSLARWRLSTHFQRKPTACENSKILFHAK